MACAAIDETSRVTEQEPHSPCKCLQVQPSAETVQPIIIIPYDAADLQEASAYRAANRSISRSTGGLSVTIGRFEDLAIRQPLRDEGLPQSACWKWRQGVAGESLTGRTLICLSRHRQRRTRGRRPIS
jgi:hypothetical protein